MDVMVLRSSMVIHLRTPSCNFTQFHAIITQFHPILAISAIFGKFQHVGYKKACTQAEKLIGGTGRCHRPQDGAAGPKKGGQRSPIPRALCKSLSQANKLLKY